jgi:hypothetical protein
MAPQSWHASQEGPNVENLKQNAWLAERAAIVAGQHVVCDEWLRMVPDQGGPRKRRRA